MMAVLRRGWYAAVPAGVALLLGLWGIGTPGTWLDERFTIEAVSDGLSSHYWDAPMLPYYSLMWLWTGGGAAIDESWLRLPSVLSVAVAAGCASVAARRLGSVRAGIAAGMLVALAPGVARYALEARTYAPAAALVTFATMALVLAMSGSSRRWWVGYSVAMALAILVLPVSLVALPAHAVAITGFMSWRTRGRDWVAACIPLIPVLALEFFLATQFSGLRDYLGKPNLSDLAAGLTMIGNSEYTGTPGTVFALVLVVLAALSTIGLRWLAGLAVAVVAVFFFSVTLGNWWLPRTFIPLAGILCIAAGSALARVDWTRVLVVLGILGVVALPAQRAIREPGSRGTDPREVAAVVDIWAEQGDQVRVSPTANLAWWSVRHYLRDDPRLTPTEAPSSQRYWELGGEVTCEQYREWPIAGGRPLRLCL